jgi:hypothetical protein
MTSSYTTVGQHADVGHFHEFPNLYHYTSMESALKIVESQTLLMSGREQFNDPFDCRVPFAHGDQIQSIIDEIKRCVRQIAGGLPCRYSDRPYFQVMIDSFPLLLGQNPPSFDTNFDKNLRIWIEENLGKISPRLLEIAEIIGSSTVLVSFGISEKNISLWGHYGRSHTGVAIEFEFPVEHWKRDLYKVEYMQAEPNWLDTQQWCDLLFNYDGVRKTLEGASFLRKSFTFKSSDWEKEQEVRFVRFREDATIERPPMHLNPGEMTRVLIGLNADPTLAGILIKVCQSKNIPVAQMEIDPEKFAVRAIQVNAP